MVTLGLDISTTCVGYAFTENKKIFDMGFIDLKKIKDTREKVFFVIDFSIYRNVRNIVYADITIKEWMR